jgi:FtsP/CotA-like multicopper oxidase with cupredoxin domain
MSVDLAGRVVETVGYNGKLPGPELRVRAGDEMEVRFRDDLGTPTTIHWHGLALRNDMDGVPVMTQSGIAPGESFVYRFVVPDPGTYWFHPHMGLDLDRGMYAPLIVEDPNEPVRYDAEAVLVLDDWLDGIDGASPESTYRALASGKAMSGMAGMSGMGMGASSGSTSMADLGDVDYPLHLVNGRPRADAPTVLVPASGRIRLRLINAGSDTIYRVAIGGQSMKVTHVDGFPIEPVEVDAVSLSMGERIDVVVAPGSGVWPVLAVAEGKEGASLAWLRAGSGTAAAPTVGDRLAEHDRRLFDVASARATESVALPVASPDRTVDLRLTGSMMDYKWGINGRAFVDHRPVEVAQGERLRIRFRNETSMVHPMHLHGHTFALAGDRGARKDTVLVNPMASVSVDVDADNPGQWMIHCHNTYHLEAGMATSLSYVQ